MKTLKLIRTETSEQGTFGTLYDGNTSLCATGELPKHAGNPSIENERQTDCIPTGTYLCKIVNSPKFGRVYGVTDVPGRSAILIHSGNFCGDAAKGFKSHVLGCIILGEIKGVLDGQKAVLSSKRALATFMERMANEPFSLVIEEQYG